MTQDPNADAKFTLHSGETVTVTVSAVKTSCLTDAAFAGNILPKSTLNPDVYSFTVTGAIGKQPRFNCVCNFAKKDLPDAHYTINVSSSGGGNFTVGDIAKEAPEASFMLYFLIN